MNKEDLRKSMTLYYARIMPKVAVYEVDEVSVRTIEDTYFVATEKQTKRAFPFAYKDLDEIVFKDRKDALNKVKEAEKHKTKIVSEETYYEEY